MNTQIRAAGLRLQLAQVGVNVEPQSCSYIGDDCILGKIEGMAEVPEYRVDEHDEELGLISVAFPLLEEAYYESAM